MKIGDPIDLTVLNNRMVAIFDILTQLRYFLGQKNPFFAQNPPKVTIELPIVLGQGVPGLRGPTWYFA